MPCETRIDLLANYEDWLKGWREGWQEGRRQGLLKWIAIYLEEDFGAASKRLLKEIGAIQDFEQLRAVARAVLSAKSVEDVRQALRGLGAVSKTTSA